MANITVPIQVNLPDDWIEQIVNRLRNDPESEWVEIVRCKDCKNWAVQVKDVNGDGLGSCKFHKANFVTREGYCYWAESEDK